MRKILSMLLALTATASLAFAATETVDCGGSATLNANQKTGYHFVRWEKDGVQVSTSASYQVTNIQADASYTAIFAPNTNTPYTVKHYQQNLDGNTYPAVATDVDNLTGTTGTNTAAEAKEYVGFTPQSVVQGTIAADGTTVITIKYTRNKYALSWVTDGDALTGAYTSGLVLYGAAITAPNTPTKIGYTFAGWTPATSATMPAEATTYTATWTPATVHYTVKHWQQNLANDDYTEVVGDREDKTGTTGTNTVAAAKSYTGFNSKPFSQTSIAADGSTVINIYYDRLTYTINFYKDSPADAGNKIAGFGGTFKYGATVTAPVAGTDFQVKEATAQYTYTFDAWSPSISYTVTGNAEYVATWASHLRSYTITFQNWNGTELQSTSVPYGTTPVYGGADPEKAGSTWTGWSPAVVAVTGEATYTATFDADTYAITVGKEGEGTVTGAGNYTYGATPTITATAAPCYTFKGWKKNGSAGYVSTDASYTLPAITGVATYTAVFELNTFTITVTSNDESMGTVTVTKP